MTSIAQLNAHLQASNELKHGKIVHIEMLKGIAILMVLAFHLNKYIACSGFHGVDVFFVISGYFVLRNYVSGNESKDSIGAFFKKRTVRLCPPLLAMLAFVLPIICAICYYGDILRAAETGFCTLLGISNHYLEFCSHGYFAADAFKNPMVHLWYLSTLIQCYIFFIVIINCTQRYIQGKVGRCLILAIIAATSFLLNQFPSLTDNLFGYYSSTTRLWVFIAGGMTTLLPNIALHKHSIIQTIIIGLAIALALSTIISCNTNIPTVIVAMLIIRYADDTYILDYPGAKFLYGTGRISYSLYLWHMPIIVLAKYLADSQPYHWDRILLIPLSLALGYLSYHLFEQKHMRVKTIFISYTVILSIYAAAVYTHGFKELLHVNVYNITNISTQGFQIQPYTKGDLLHDYPKDDLHSNAVVNFESQNLWELFTKRKNQQRDDKGILALGNRQGAATFVLLGDSHAAAIAPGLNKSAIEHGWHGIYPKAYIVPFYSVAYDKEAQKSPYATKLSASAALMAWLGRHPELQTVIIAQRWSIRKEYYESVFYPGNPEAIGIMEKELREYLTRIKQAGKHVLILTEAPRYSEYDVSKLYKHLILGKPISESMYHCSKHEYSSGQASGYFERLFTQLVEEGICDRVLHTERAFLKGNLYSAIECGKLYMYDDDHVNNLGAYKVINALVPELAPFIATPLPQPTHSKSHP